MCNCWYFIFKSCASDTGNMRKVLASVRGPTRSECLAGDCCPKNDSKLLSYIFIYLVTYCKCKRSCIWGTSWYTYILKYFKIIFNTLNITCRALYSFEKRINVTLFMTWFTWIQTDILKLCNRIGPPVCPSGTFTILCPVLNKVVKENIIICLACHSPVVIHFLIRTLLHSLPSLFNFILFAF